MKPSKPNIIHVSYDIGDFNKTDKTTAVSNLISAASRYTEPYVISLDRVNSPGLEVTRTAGQGLLKINSFGLPYGIFHKYTLNRAYSKIESARKDALLKFSRIELVHAHKLTFEGFLGYRLSTQLNLPLFISLRQTDFDVLRYRPDLRSLYKKILKHSSAIFYLVPIMLDLLKERYGRVFVENEIAEKLYYLPNIVQTKKTSVAEYSRSGAPLITIARLNKKSVKRKNLKNLIIAAGRIKNRSFRLDIIGGGDYSEQVQKWINHYDMDGKVNLIGEIPHHQIDDYYASSKGFVMPSFSESFGLVYAESLLNGTPILYSKGVIGFDGVFDGVGPSVNPFSVESIQHGLMDILDKNEEYRSKIVQLEMNGAFKIFSPEYAAETYRDALSGIFPEFRKKSQLGLHHKTKVKS